MTPRVIANIKDLASRYKEVTDIFHSVAKRGRHINVMQKSLRGQLIFGISDGPEPGINFTEWRFKTNSKTITANYHEIWILHGRDNYFLERSYFHLYNVKSSSLEESEYILLHCDACEPDNSPHSIYKQSPHIHVKAAHDPIPKAHFALYNGRTKEILETLESYNEALSESVKLLDSQILKLHD